MPAYLDHAATTPMRPEAVAAMLPFLTDQFGNPSGSHAWSRAARQAIEEARDVVAACLGARPGEVVFTGSGTEADNLALFGVHAVRGGTGYHTFPDAELVETDQRTGELLWSAIGWKGSVFLRLATRMRANIDESPCPRCRRTTPRVTI